MKTLNEPPETSRNTVVLQPDIEKYKAQISHMDMSDTQANELIHTLFQIMSSFVDLGFGIHPVQNRLLPDISFPSETKPHALKFDFEHHTTDEKDSSSIHKRKEAE